MSEFDQEENHKRWFADPDFNPAQCNVAAAEHRENRTAEKHAFDYDCLGQLIDPRSRLSDFARSDQHKVRPPSYDKKIGLVLQGGGALGSYQAGVYEALASSEYLPDWVAGISIGAINAAIIVGNAPENRVKRLRGFWEEVTAQTNLVQSAPVGSPTVWQQRSSALTALMFGQPGFFTPRALKDWLSPGSLRQLLRRLRPQDDA